MKIKFTFIAIPPKKLIKFTKYNYKYENGKIKGKKTRNYNIKKIGYLREQACVPHPNASRVQSRLSSSNKQ